MDKIADFIVIGGGMAGSSAAAELSRDASVILIEAEERPGFHSTGRSAALFSELYGNAAVRALSRASRSLLFDPPASFAETPLVSPRGVIFIASADQVERLAAFAAEPDVAPLLERLTVAQAIDRVPALRPDRLAAALLEPDACDIDVDGLHQAWLRQLRRNGGTVMTSSRVDGLRRLDDGNWQVSIGDTTLSARVIVNAAGAWADQVALLASVRTIGLRPCRRTAILVDPPLGMATAQWPMVIDTDEQFYVKPDAGLLLMSPADETPTEPCDAQPDEWDIALAVDRVTAMLDIPVRAIRHRWAGLRSFVEDRTPVVGFAPDAPGFFWLAGQGGYGIQTAPAMARITAALATGRQIPADLMAYGIHPADLSPARFATEQCPAC